jgi:probable HAF family extracellular repeat protein
MKSKTLCIIATTLFAALAIPIHLAAQNNQDSKPVHHHYKLIDVGTLGGPQSYVNAGSGNEFGNFAQILNNRGTMTGSADTSTPDPFPGFCSNDDCFVSHAFEWKNGAKTDLGALPGGASSASNWISANGLIAGFSQNGEIDPLVPGLPEVRAVIWRNGAIRDLGTLPEGGFESIAAAINDRGQTVGLAINTIPDPDSMVGIGFQTRTFLWQDGAMKDLGTLGTGTDAQAILINEKGQVVGWSYINSVPTNACLEGFAFVTGSFIWDKENGMRDLGSLGGTCTTASDINNHGQIVGFSNLPGDLSEHGFLWNNVSFQDLGGSLGGDFLGPFAINDSGEAVGFAFLPGDTIGHAVLWKHVGDMADLGGVGADQCSYATSINAATQVVGTSSDCVSTSRVFLWEDGSIFDLNALIPPSSPLSLQFAETINDRGEIAGTGVDAGGNEHAFLAIPCDENHPDIEGCDYDAVDSAAASEARPVQTIQTPAATPSSWSPAEMMARFRSLRAGRIRRFGAPQTSSQ